MKKEDKEQFVETRAHVGFITEKCREMSLQDYEIYTMCPETVGSNNYLMIFKLKESCELRPSYNHS